MELNFEVVTWKFAYICCIFIDIGLVAVLYDYNFPKQDLLKNSLIVFFFFLLLSLSLFNPFYSDEAAVCSVNV